MNELNRIPSKRSFKVLEPESSKEEIIIESKHETPMAVVATHDTPQVKDKQGPNLTPTLENNIE